MKCELEATKIPLITMVQGINIRWTVNCGFHLHWAVWSFIGSTLYTILLYILDARY